MMGGWWNVAEVKVCISYIWKGHHF